MNSSSIKVDAEEQRTNWKTPYSVFHFFFVVFAVGVETQINNRVFIIAPWSGDSGVETEFLDLEL
jgi:hypothetical protein